MVPPPPTHHHHTLPLLPWPPPPCQVFELMPDGTAIPRWSTHNKSLFQKFSQFDVHGGPPVAFVSAQQVVGGGGDMHGGPPEAYLQTRRGGHGPMVYTALTSQARSGT